jgi:ubiquitin-protein ligase
MSLSAISVRRITIDCRKVQDLDPSLGLYWVHDEADLTHGWAFVGGTEKTPYEGAMFSFEVKFPENYPFAPPVFTYLTNDGKTRFNPNLYKNGKVCLSLLNTWAGEQWSGVQSLASILQSIQSAVLIEEPLRNEPTYSNMSLHADIPIYTRLVQHAVLETAIVAALADPPTYMVPVYHHVRAWFLSQKEGLLGRLRALAATHDGQAEVNNFFQMGQRYAFGALIPKLEAIV